jgi:Chalcone isomerase-like
MSQTTCLNRRRLLLRSLPGLALLPLAPLLASAPAWAQPVVIEGQAFERRVTLAGSELLLNGTGVRAVAWFKGYAAGLYLRTPSRNAAEAVAQAGPKRLQMRMLQDVPAAEFVKAFRKGVERNTAAAELPALAERMASFEALVGALGKVRKGDLVNLDLEPGRGTVFSVNGTLRGEAIAGEDFFAALLRSFVGERPYDSKLKAGLLAGAV